VKEATVSEIKRLETERRSANRLRGIFDDDRRSQLLKDSLINPRADSEAEVVRLRSVRSEALRSVERLEAELTRAYGEAGGEPSIETMDPRSYIRALAVQLENARSDLNEIESRYRTYAESQREEQLGTSGDAELKA
jgi:hypothetical protein